MAFPPKTFVVPRDLELSLVALKGGRGWAVRYTGVEHRVDEVVEDIEERTQKGGHFYNILSLRESPAEGSKLIKFRSILINFGDNEGKWGRGKSGLWSKRM